MIATQINNQNDKENISLVNCIDWLRLKLSISQYIWRENVFSRLNIVKTACQYLLFRLCCCNIEQESEMSRENTLQYSLIEIN